MLRVFYKYLEHFLIPMSIKVLKYKQPLYESFDFDNEEADDKFDQDFADNLRKQKMLSNLPNLS